MHHVRMCVHEAFLDLSKCGYPFIFKQLLVILLDMWNHQPSPQFQTHLYNTASASRPVQQNSEKKIL